MRPGLRLATGGAALGALWVVFGGLVEPDKAQGCASGLEPGLYGDLLVPLHALAFAVLAALVWRGDPRPRTARILAALAAVGILALLVDVVAGVLFWVAVLGIVPGSLVAAGFAAARRRHPGTEQWLLWFLLAAALPATLAFSYLHGASLFCF